MFIFHSIEPLHQNIIYENFDRNKISLCQELKIVEHKRHVLIICSDLSKYWRITEMRKYFKFPNDLRYCNSKLITCIKMGRKAVSMDTKKKIFVSSEVGLSKTVIAQRCNVSRNCVIQTIRKYNEEHTVSTKVGTGRPSKLTDRQKRAIKLEQLRDDTLSLNDLVRYTQAYLGVKIG